MNKLNLTLVFTALLANFCFTNCLDASPQSNLSTVITLEADKAAYNPGQQVVLDVNFK